VNFLIIVFHPISFYDICKIKINMMKLIEIVNFTFTLYDGDIMLAKYWGDSRIITSGWREQFTTLL